MRKALIALAIAGALTAPMIAQADATLLMQAPGMFFQYEADQRQPALVAETVAVKASDRTLSQPEAVAVLADKSGEIIGPVTVINYRPGHAAIPVTGPDEVGWRS